MRLLAQNVKDLSGNLITSPSSVTIVITKPDSTTATITTPVNDGSGNYHYDYQILSTDPVGKWSHQWTFVAGTLTSIEESTFTVNTSRIQ